MQSTGNDIVALNLVDTKRSNDSRFYSRIISASEKEYYERSAFAAIGFDYFLWLCWSVKESAYKYLKRNDPALLFSPTRIIVRHITIPVHSQMEGMKDKEWNGLAFDEQSYHGTVMAGDSIYYFRSKLFHELITTVVSEDEKFENTFWGYASINNSGADQQSRSVRSFLLQNLRSVLPGNELRIEKAPGNYPVLFNGTNELNIPISFAHHGIFVAYSYSLPS
jgi:phosphopantetheinyl transferase (holo-ACP synthase)